MSHTSTISGVQIVSISALTAAVAELNKAGVKCELIKGGTPRAFYANQENLGPADYIVKLADAPYDIGLYKNGDAFEARTDFWGGHVERCLGGRATTEARADQAKMGRLFQLYAVHAATEKARRQGHSVRRVVQPSGKIILEITGSNL